MCAAFDVDGMRADLVVARTAVAHAAWRASVVVTAEDIRVAVELALPHRHRRDPFDDPGIDPDELDQMLAEAGGADLKADHEADPEPDPDPPGGEPVDSGAETIARQGNSRSRSRPSAPGSYLRTQALTVPGVGEAPRAGGRPLATPPGGGRSQPRRPGPWAAPLPQCSPPPSAQSGLRGRCGRGADDVRSARRIGREGNLVIFVVDASGSMAARDRMAAVGGAALSLLRDAYQRRGQGCGHHIPGRPGHATAAADHIGAHRRRGDWPASTPAAPRHWPAACSPRAAWFDGAGP